MITSIDFLLKKLEGYRERLQLLDEVIPDDDLEEADEEDTALSTDSKEHFKTLIN